MASHLGDFIEEKFGRATLEELAERTGITVPTLSRLKNGGKPSLENGLRLAAAAGEHPATVHRLAGQADIAALYLAIFPQDAGVREERRSPRAARVLERCRRLCDLGLGEALRDALDEVERELWAPMRSSLERLARRFGAESAALLVERSGLRVAVARWQCDEVEARSLEVSPAQERGWRICRSHPAQGDGFALILALRRPAKMSKAKADWSLEIWMGMLRGLLQRP